MNQPAAIPEVRLKKLQENIDQGMYDPHLSTIIEMFMKRRAEVAPIKRVARKRAVSNDEVSDVVEPPAKKKLRASKIAAPYKQPTYVCRESMCGESFTDKDALYVHRREKHNKELVRRKAPVLKAPDESEWVEWTGRAKPASRGSATTFVCKFNGAVYEKSEFVGKCFRIPSDFGHGCADARIIIDGVGEKSVKARFFHKPDGTPALTAASRYWKPSKEGAPCFLDHAVLKEHL